MAGISVMKRVVAANSEGAWTDVRVIPAYGTALSAILLALYALARHIKSRNRSEVDCALAEEVVRLRKEAGFVKTIGGCTILSYKLLRVLACAVFFGASVALFFGGYDGGEMTVCVATVLTAVYTIVLSFLLLSPSLAAHSSIAWTLNLILFVTVLVYGWRDLWPYATYDQVPMDSGPFTWVLIDSVLVAGVFVPLFTPRVYKPIDPHNSSPTSAPEQTASLISLVSFSFLDPLILLGNRVSHLKLNQIPLLPDYDAAIVLRKRAFKHIDQFAHGKKVHVFWGMVWFLRKPLVIQLLMACGMAVAEILSPITMNRLLAYLETGGVHAIVRPWFWIFGLFLAPLLTALFKQWYSFEATHCAVMVESVMTQLLFEHALRIRMKAETQGVSPGGQSDVDEPAVESPPLEIAAVTRGAELNENFAPVNETASPLTQQQDADSATAVGPDSSSFQGGREIEEKDDAAQSKNIAGRINNLISTDIAQIQSSKDVLSGMVYAPVEMVFNVVFLYVLLGWSSIIGLSVLVALTPIPALFTKQFHGIQKAKMGASDERVQSVSETVSVLRMIKFFAWESRVEKGIAKKREKETHFIWKQHMNIMFTEVFINKIIPLSHMIVTYWVYTVFMKKNLTPSIVFSSMTVFDLIRNQFSNVMYRIPSLVRAKVSFDRINEFLVESELLDKYTTLPYEGCPVLDASPPNAIGFGSAEFTWTASPSRHSYVLSVEQDLVFKKGRMNLIVGPTGSGKTSMLMALLGEMHFVPVGPAAWSNLPREGGVAYAAQESWVLNETIRDNIVFGAPYDDARYKQVIYQCALKRDLELFNAGDLTEVGEKGLTLSGGQKARLTLARAVYSSADTLLLDDVLAALDVHTSRWIVQKCFKGDLLRGRTVICVTHNIALARPIADFVVTLGTDGRIRSQGSILDVLNRDATFRHEMAEEEELLSKTAEAITIDAEDFDTDPAATGIAYKTSGKLIVEEEVEIGRKGMSTLLLLARSMAGRWGIIYWVILSAFVVATEIVNTVQIWWLGRWANAYAQPERGNGVALTFYLAIYITLIAAGLVLYAATVVQHATVISWLDSTPTSRIITRCTHDINALDFSLVMDVLYASQLTVSMFVQLVAVIILTPIFLIPGVVIAIIGIKLGNMYMTAQLSIKREMSKAKSPVIGHFSAAIAGLVSIRAYGAEEAFKLESQRRIDVHARTARSFYNVSCWIGLRISALSSIFTAALAAYMVYVNTGQNASNVGFSLNMAIGFSTSIFWWVWQVNDLEVQSSCLERIRQYLLIEHEPDTTLEGKPPAHWPTSGQLAVEKLSARYSPDGPRILKDISFTINSGERIGIVGRTGSGKSSLALSLLRTVLTDGEVYFDGILTSKLNLEALRSNITVIPQVPELLSGTLRHNLDPFGQHDDAALNNVLRSSGLTLIQSETVESRLTLESVIASGGGNLSVGQRQILALARAMLRQSRILILDEATSAIDYETDTVIQQSLRNEFKDVTVITIAHRLQTIMDSDKIMVLDQGRMVEFDQPRKLLENKDGLLFSLVNESSDRDLLISMAGP